MMINICLLYNISFSRKDVISFLITSHVSDEPKKKTITQFRVIVFFTMLRGLLHSFVNYFPINDVPEGIYVVCTAVLIIQIVGMFPHVKA